MRIRLAGFNVDYDALKNMTGFKKLTPETLSAAYARISRSPKPVNELRSQAHKEVEKARASNRNIIFGMGHHSVAEHAVFNFDIIGISRRAVEELEHHRLCSYTEKSQRYVTLKGDYVIPPEIESTLFKSDFEKIIARQNECYNRLYEKIVTNNYLKYPQKSRTRQGKKLLENHAKEDARYILSLATQAQLGMTVNARNLELIIRRFASHPMYEMRELGDRLYELASRIAPSLLLFCKASVYDTRTYTDIALYARGLNISSPVSSKETHVKLIAHTQKADNEVLAALLFHTTDMSLIHCRRAIAKMSSKKKHNLFKQACKHVELYDTMLREFEQAIFTYQLIVSAGCFGQLKRHRMATLICQDYDPRLGVTIPESVIQAGEKEAFIAIIRDTENTYRTIKRLYPHIGSYVLTNAHRRRVLMSVNLRELYHISRLREDPTAQWDIRTISSAMTKLAGKAMPICGQLLGGKEEYPLLYKRIFKHYPKVRHTPES